MLADALGLPVAFTIAEGQIADCSQAVELVAEAGVTCLLADTGYNTGSIRGGDHRMPYALDENRGTRPKAERPRREFSSMGDPRSRSNLVLGVRESESSS